MTIENPTVRDVDESLRSHIKNNDRMNKTITEEGLSELMDIVYCAAFSEIDISEEEYSFCHSASLVVPPKYPK